MSDTWPYPKPTDDGAADHLQPGVQLPRFSLPATDGQSVSLADLKGHNIIFVYPFTGRPGLKDPPNWDVIPGAHGSTPQAEGIAALYPEFQALGVGVYGLSGQDTSHQRELTNRLKLPFAILSDEDLTVQRALDLPTFDTGGRRYLKRLTLIVDKGQITKTFYPVHPPDEHPSKVLDWLRAQTSQRY